MPYVNHMNDDALEVNSFPTLLFRRKPGKRVAQNDTTAILLLVVLAANKPWEKQQYACIQNTTARITQSLLCNLFFPKVTVSNFPLPIQSDVFQNG